MRNLFRKFVALNLGLSNFVDRALFGAMRVDGNEHFQRESVPKYVGSDLLVYDLGGGRRPFFSAEERAARRLRVRGLDIAAEELAAAPPGAYDATLVADLSRFEGGADGDLVICQSILEHVRDMRGALRGIASVLRPGGVALVFLPCRNAAFARLNLLLPQGLKRRLLFAVFPHMAEGQGFPVFYDDALPSLIKRHAAEHGLEVVEERYFYISAYFFAFFPAYLVWRLWTWIARRYLGPDFCETFILVLRKR